MHRIRSGRALTNLALATLLFVSAVVPLLSHSKVGAYGLVTSRAIKMSSSVVSATNTSYEVTFNPSGSSTVKSLAVDFCSNTPIIGDTTCTAPTSFTVGTPSVTTSTSFTGSWTAASLNSGRTLTLTKAAGDTFSSGTQVKFTITTVTNPSTTGTFYARIYTFPNDTTTNDATDYTPSNLGTNVPTDAGGVALSTAAQINITSKVQERLTFCVYTTGAGNDCTSKSGTAVALGDTNGVLDPSGPYVDKNAKYTISTNATSNAIVRMKGTTLTSGANTIAATGGTAVASSAGTNQFGMCNYQSAGSGLTATSPYDDTNCSGTSQTAGTGSTGGNGTALFAFDDSGTGTTSTYGDDIATKPAGNFSTSTLVFLGNVSNSAPAGIYTTALTFIATGTY